MTAIVSMRMSSALLPSGRRFATRCFKSAALAHSAKGSARERVDLGALLNRAANELKDIAAKRGLEAVVAPARGELPAAVEPELADRLLLRLFGALAERAEPGERLQVAAE